MQAVHPVQVVSKLLVPPVEKVPAEHEVQVLATLSNPKPAVHPEQAPVVAVQEEHPVQSVQDVAPAREKVPVPHALHDPPLKPKPALQVRQGRVLPFVQVAQSVGHCANTP
jgi:hypothetical protein